MAQQTWFVVRGGKEEGPYTGTALKDMAASGKLRPGDLVRRADVETARPASQIKGLFTGGGAAEPLPPNPPADRGTAPAPTSKKRLVIVAAVAGALVLLCGGVGVLVTVFNKEKQAAQKELAEADGLWNSGDKAGAAAKYRALLQNKSHKAAVKGELAPVYGRVIDYEIEQGDKDAAKALLDEATSAKVTPAVSHPEAKALVSAPSGTQPSAGPSTPVSTEDVLTADYYPFPSGTKRQTLGRLFLSDTMSVQYRKEYAYGPGGMIDVRWLHKTGPGGQELPPSKPYKLLHRAKDGYVEISEDNEGLKKTVWHPVVKVGAKLGDTWEREVVPGTTETYRLAKFGEPQKGNKEIDFDGAEPRGKVYAAFIEVRIVTALGGKSLVTGEEYELGRGVGPVSRTAFEGEGKGRKTNWTEFLTRPLKK